MSLANIPNSFLETIFWAKPENGDISVAFADDSGTVSSANLSSNLSEEELYKATLLVDPIERRHFLFRRCFQRVFLHALLDFEGQTKQIAVVHQLDRRSVCLNALDYVLSFSSSAGATIAAASCSLDIGIDIELIRPIENVAALALRFFTDEEAEFIATLPPQQQNIAFLKTWTAKEAGLKAIGRGIVDGLNTFVRTVDDRIYMVGQEQKSEIPTPWALDYMNLSPDHMVAVVHKPREIK